MITPEERREIIDTAKEEILLSLPEVIGSLMVNHAAMLKNNKAFYDAHPEFKEHKDLVAAVIEQVEGANTIADHSQIMEQAVPEIRKRLLTLKSLNTTTVPSKPDLGAI